MAAASDEKLKLVLNSFVDSLFSAYETVKENEKEKDEAWESVEDFKREDFWKSLGAVVSTVSKETTNVSVMFSKPPYPSAKECQGLVTRLQTAVLMLLSIFCQLPRSIGHSLHKSVRQAVFLVVEGVIAHLQTLCAACRAERKLQTTGTVWEHCDAFLNLPRDNCAAVLVHISSTMELIKDALTEIDEFQTSQETAENGASLSSKEASFLPPCIGLVKASKAVLKKLQSSVKSRGRSLSINEVQELDRIENLTSTFSSGVDDLVLNFYESPINTEKLLEDADKLSKSLRDSLDYARSCHFCMESDASWVDFLQKAVQHNFKKLSDLATGQENTET